MTPTQYLRIEGLAILVGALVVYFNQDGPVWLLIVLGLAPDISMLGYLLGPRRGSHIYNGVHTYVSPLTLASVALFFEVQFGLLVALIWIGHIGADRLFGYGLKFETGFTDTHLTAQPVPVTALDNPPKDT